MNATPLALDISTYADRQRNEDEKPRCVVRVSTQSWRDRNNLYWRKRIQFLRRKSRLHEILDHDADLVGASEVIDKIVNLNEVPDGVYLVLTCNETHDWETPHIIDDYDYRLVPFIENEPSPQSVTNDSPKDRRNPKTP